MEYGHQVLFSGGGVHSFANTFLKYLIRMWRHRRPARLIFPKSFPASDIIRVTLVFLPV
jgi:hypothetical protein